MRSRYVIVPGPAFSIIYVIRWVSSPVDLPTVRFPFIIVRDEFVNCGSCRNPTAQAKLLKYGNDFAFFASHGESERNNPESIAAQWIPGCFYIFFWKRVALIFYRDIDCQDIIGVYAFHGFHFNPSKQNVQRDDQGLKCHLFSQHLSYRAYGFWTGSLPSQWRRGTHTYVYWIQKSPHVAG